MLVGVVDAVSILSLGRVFVANMTGNVVFVGFALAGASGLYRFDDLVGTPELVVSGGSLVGVAFGPAGELVVASNETAYLFEHY